MLKVLRLLCSKDLFIKLTLSTVLLFLTRGPTCLPVCLLFLSKGSDRRPDTIYCLAVCLLFLTRSPASYSCLSTCLTVCLCFKESDEHVEGILFLVHDLWPTWVNYQGLVLARGPIYRTAHIFVFGPRGLANIFKARTYACFCIPKGLMINALRSRTYQGFIFYKGFNIHGQHLFP